MFRLAWSRPPIHPEVLLQKLTRLQEGSFGQDAVIEGEQSCSNVAEGPYTCNPTMKLEASPAAVVQGLMACR